MVAAPNRTRHPLHLAVSGEAQTWLPALERIVGPQWLRPRLVRDERELLDVIGAGRVHAAVLDDEAEWALDVLQLLRLVRQLNAMLPVVVVTRHSDRRWLENALRLTVFSVVTKPLQLEALLRQIERMMTRLDARLRDGTAEP